MFIILLLFKPQIKLFKHLNQINKQNSGTFVLMSQMQKCYLPFPIEIRKVAKFQRYFVIDFIFKEIEIFLHS